MGTESKPAAASASGAASAGGAPCHTIPQSTIVTPMGSPARQATHALRGSYAHIYDAARVAKLKQGSDSVSGAHAMSACIAGQQQQHELQPQAPGLEGPERQACRGLDPRRVQPNAPGNRAPSPGSAEPGPGRRLACHELHVSQHEHGARAPAAEPPSGDTCAHAAYAVRASCGACVAPSCSEVPGSAQHAAPASDIPALLSRQGSRARSDRAVEELLLSEMRGGKQQRTGKPAARAGALGKLLSCFTGCEPLEDVAPVQPPRSRKGAGQLVLRSSAGNCAQQRPGSWRIPSHIEVRVCGARGVQYVI